MSYRTNLNARGFLDINSSLSIVNPVTPNQTFSISGTVALGAPTGSEYVAAVKGYFNYYDWNNNVIGSSGTITFNVNLSGSTLNFSYTMPGGTLANKNYSRVSGNIGVIFESNPSDGPFFYSYPQLNLPIIPVPSLNANLTINDYGDTKPILRLNGSFSANTQGYTLTNLSLVHDDNSNFSSPSPFYITGSNPWYGDTNVNKPLQQTIFYVRAQATYSHPFGGTEIAENVDSAVYIPSGLLEE